MELDYTYGGINNLLKDYTINLELYDRRIQKTKVQYVQGDTKAYDLTINLTKYTAPLTLPQNATILINFDIGNKNYILKGEAIIKDYENGIISYSFQGSELNKAVTVTASVELYNEGGRITFPQFTFDVIPSLGSANVMPPKPMEPWVTRIINELNDRDELSKGLLESIKTRADTFITELSLSASDSERLLNDLRLKINAVLEELNLNSEASLKEINIKHAEIKALFTEISLQSGYSNTLVQQAEAQLNQSITHLSTAQAFLKNFPYLHVLGCFDTLEELQKAYPSGSSVNACYAVNEYDNPHFYFWDSVNSQWVDAGSLKDSMPGKLDEPLHRLNCVIHHNLNKYPLIQIIRAINGAGIGGAGEYPAGGSNLSEVAKWSYIDKNNIDVYVADDYGDCELIKISDTEFNIVFYDTSVNESYKVILL